MGLSTVTVLVLCAIVIHSTNACSPPIGPIHKSFKKEFEEAKTVVKVRFDSIIRLPQRQTNTYKVTVKTIYKGCVPGDGKTLYISTGSNSALCGSSFRLSKTYVMMLGDVVDVDVKRELKRPVLILPVPDTITAKGYYVNLFSFYRRASTVSKGQKRFLRNASKLEANKCV